MNFHMFERQSSADAITLIRSALNRIGMGAASSGHEVRNSAMLVPLIVVNMTVENDDAKRSVSLACLEHFG